MFKTTLRKALCANALFSLVCGLELLLLPATVAALLGDIPTLPLQVIGAGLLLFAAQLLWVASRTTVAPLQARLITWADWGWVAATPVAMLLLSERLALSGHLLLTAVAAVVALCAYFQGVGLQREPG